MKLNAWARQLAASMLLAVPALLHAPSARSYEPPKPPQIVARPAYVDLVKAMREDELYFLAHNVLLEETRHDYNARCIANLKASHLTKALAWTLSWNLSEQEATEARAFFETDAGRKWVSRDITAIEKKVNLDDPSLPQFSIEEMLGLARFMKTTAGEKLLRKGVNREKLVVDTVRAEMRERLYNCTETLAGTMRINYCESAYLPNPGKTCSARYQVAGRAGTKPRETVVEFFCPNPLNAGSVLRVPGQQETIGLLWHENDRLEVLLPPGVKPDLSGSAHEYYRGPKIEYRVRRPTDAPAAACVPTPPLDELGWPLD